MRRSVDLVTISHSRPTCAFAAALVALMPIRLRGAAGDTEICPVKDNKAGIVSFVSDDGIIESLRNYVSYFERDGLRGSVAIVTDWVEPGTSGMVRDESNQGVDHGTWSDWIEMHEGGHLDFDNHTQTHLPVIFCDEPDFSTDTELDFEVNGAKHVIDSVIPNYNVLTFVYPGLQANDRAVAKVKERHWASRGPGDPMDRPVAQIGMDNLHYVGSLGVTSGTTVAEMNAWVDNAITNGRWAMEMWHGCGGLGWEAPPCAVYDQHCAYVATKLEQIWNATFHEATKYICERASATVAVTSVTASEIRVSLTDTLADTLFDFALTLRTEVPADWSDVTVMQGDNADIVTAGGEANGRYVLYNAAPDNGEILLAKGIVVTRGRSRAAGRAFAFACDGGNLRIHVPCGDAGSTIRLCDLAGRVLFSLDPRTQTVVTVSRERMRIAAGTYVLSVGSGGDKIASRLFLH